MNHSLLGAIIHLVVTGVSVLVVGKVLPGIEVKSFGSALWFAFVVGVLNALVWHFLPFAAASWLVSILTLGIGAIVLNGVIFLVADKFSSGVRISGCFIAAIASIGVSILNMVFEALIRQFHLLPTH